MTEPLTGPELGELYQRYAPAVHRRALKLLQDDGGAWDMVHEVFERLLAHPASFRREASAMTFLYRMTTNLCLNQLRSRWRRQQIPEALSEASPGGGPSEARNLLRALSAQLDERALQIAALHFLDGLTQEQIGPVVGLSRKTVGRELERIRRLASALAREPGHG